MEAIRLDKQYTYGDYVTWDDGQRWELDQGLPIRLSPAPVPRHQLIAFRLGGMVYDYLEKSGSACRAFPAPFDVRFPEGNEPDEQVRTVFQPDLSLFCDLSKIDSRGARGAPDWVVEVVSPSTLWHDRRRKLGTYERAGVKEYWHI